MGRFEQLANDVMHEHAHQSSAVIMSRQHVAQCEAEEIERGIIQIKVDLARLRERRNIVLAHLRGYSMVIEKR